MRWARTVGWIVVAVGIGVPAGAAAHPGGLNAEGCHNDRKRGGYHCHRPQARAPTAGATRRSTFTGAAAVGSGGGRAFRNCTEARAAGAAPVRIGDPGYGPHLDRDRDGIGCE